MQDNKPNPSQQTPSSFPNGKEYKGDSLSQQERDGAGLLLAPNGEPSNLSPVLYAYVRTPEFKNWFGDWEKGLHIMQNNDSYYRGQYEEPLIDERGNLILKGKKDSLYIKAGYDIEEGVSATTDMSSAEEYGVNQRYAYEADVEDKYGELDQSWEKEQELNDIAEHGYYLIQFPKNIFNQIINEAGEVKIVGDVIIPKGQYVIEHITDDDRKIIATANDNTTKIVDDNGEPLVLYRGQMSHADVPFVNHGDGIYFTPQRKAAIGYGIDHDPIPVFLNARNPYEVDFEGDSDIEETDYHADIKSEYHYARENDFDILIATNTFDGENDLDQYVVHDNAQIKRIDTLNPKQIIANVLKEDLQNNGISVDNDILRNYYGLSHLVASQNKNIVTLNQIVAAQQNVGNGSQFMRDLIDLADKNAWTLALTPDTSLGATSANRLKNFYRQFGFVENKGKNADFNTKESMVRPTQHDAENHRQTDKSLDNSTKRPKTYGAPYQGSKNRIADKIIEALPKGKRFVDLFSGGGAVAHAALLSNRFETVHVNDRFPAGQRLFIQGVKGEWQDKQLKPITEEDFKKIIGTPEAIVRSVRGVGKTMAKNRNGRNREQEQLRRVQRLEQLKPYESKIQSSELDYTQVKLNENDVIYCDIPYEKTRQDGYVGKFDKQQFMDWAQKQNVPVYVSEYSMPEGWTEIAAFNVGKNQTDGKQEKLFVQDKFAEQYFAAKTKEKENKMDNKKTNITSQSVGDKNARTLAVATPNATNTAVPSVDATVAAEYMTHDNQTVFHKDPNSPIKNPQTPPSQNDIALRDKLVSLMQNAGTSGAPAL